MAMTHDVSQQCDIVFRRLIDEAELDAKSLAHLSDCAHCESARRSIQDMRRGAASVVEPISEARAEAIFGRAQRRVAMRRRGFAYAAAAVLVVAFALFAYFKPTPETGAVRSSVEYAAYLNELVFGEFGASKPDYERLKNDPALRSEFEQALEHPSTLVRKTAFECLTYSGIPVETTVAERLLAQGWDEDIDSVIETASDGDVARVLFEAREKRRVATLQKVLGGLSMQAAAHEGSVCAAVFAPYINDADDTIRFSALKGLGYAPDFEHRDAVAKIVTGDAAANVKQSALGCLKSQLPPEDFAEFAMDAIEAGVSAEVERVLIVSVEPSEETVAFARERLANDTLDDARSLLYALHMLRGGDESEARKRWRAALDSSDTTLVGAAAKMAVEGNWTECRFTLVDAAKSASGTKRQILFGRLVGWDIESDDERRLTELLELARELDDKALLPNLRRLRDALPEKLRAAADELIRSLEGED